MAHKSSIINYRATLSEVELIAVAPELTAAAGLMVLAGGVTALPVAGTGMAGAPGIAGAPGGTPAAPAALGAKRLVGRRASVKMGLAVPVTVAGGGGMFTVGASSCPGAAGEDAT
jgi:hypothetical protein